MCAKGEALLKPLLSNILQTNVSNIVAFLLHYRFIKRKRLSPLSFAKANGNVPRLFNKNNLIAKVYRLKQKGYFFF